MSNTEFEKDTGKVYHRLLQLFTMLTARKPDARELKELINASDQIAAHFHDKYKIK